MLGTVEKRISTDEMKMRRMLRRGLYARHALSAGHVLTETDIECVRPETAYLPSDFGRVVGRALRRDLAAMEPIADDAF
jgi:sialic acid synthase SpsE